MLTLKFKNEQEYLTYLENEFMGISKNEEFNIFLHCVTSHTVYYCNSITDKNKDIERKVNGIMLNGLDLDGANMYGRYGSIKATAKFFGSTNDNIDLSQISNYNFLNKSNCLYTIILLLPKHLNTDEGVIEFSSFNGEVKGSTQHSKSCVFDLVKGSYCPTYFTYACQVYDRDNNTFKLIKNEKHFSCLSEDEKEKIEMSFSSKFKDVKKHCFEKYGVTEIKDIFGKMTQEHMAEIDDFLIDP